MRLLFIFLFSLFSTLYSYEIEELLVPSTPQKLSLFEGSPNALIAGLVDPQSRKLSLSVTDLVVKGTQPLQLQRFYSSSPIPGRFDQNGEKDLYQLVDFYNTHPFHDWSYLAHQEIHEISYNPHKKVKKGFKESIYYVPHPNGTTLTFWKSCSSGGFAELRTPLSGMTNVSGERPSGIYHPKNTSLHVSDDKQQLRVKAPDGTIRLYRLAFVTPAKLYVIREGIIKQTAKYILEEEHLTNGKRIIYEWDEKTHRLKSFYSASAGSSTPYGRIHLATEVPSDREKRETFTSNGQSVTYVYTRYHGMAKGRRWDGKKEHKDKGGRYLPFFLKQISSPFYPNELLEDDGRLLLKHYSSKDQNFECFYDLSRTNPVDNVIKQLRFANETPFTLKNEEAKTIVDYANNTSTEYTYTKNHRLESIRFLENKALRKEKHFSWSPEGFLTSISIHNGSGNLLKKTTYDEYDDFGNPKKEILSGDLKGTQTPDTYTINRIFDRHLLLEEKEENGLTTQYTYHPGTNLLTEKVTLFNTTLVKKESRKYDSNLNLIEKKLENDQDLSLKTTYILYTTPEHLDLPEWKIETYFDGSQDQPLKKTHYYYDNRNNVIQEDIYDAHANLAYTLHKTYDDAGRLTSETNPLEQQATYEYDPRGNPIKTTNFSNQLTTKSTYDIKKRLKEQLEIPITGSLRTTRFEYDAHDYLIKETDHYDNPTHYSYDPITHKPILTQKPPILSPTETLSIVNTNSQYDALGNELRHTNANGNTTQYTYNARAQVTSILHPNQTKETYTYTTAGHPDTYIDQDDNTTKFSCDPFGRILQKTYLSPSGSIEATETFTYNGSHLLTETDKEGHTTTYTYDGAGRKIGIKQQVFCKI